MRLYIWLFIIIIIIIVVSCGDRSDNDTIQSDRQSIRSALEESNKILLAIEDQEIKDFVDRHGLDVEETGSGLRYQILEKGDGQEAVKDMIAVIEYRVRLLTGDMIYESSENEPKEFKIGQGGVETGLEEGILLLNKGDKAIFIMPAHLAHGLPGDGVKIPKRAPIVYDVNLIDLK